MRPRLDTNSVSAHRLLALGPSNRGLDEAVRLAKLTGGHLRLIHVIDNLFVSMAMAGYAAYSAEMFDGRGAGRMLLGSSAQYMLRIATVPVLLLRGPELSAQNLKDATPDSKG